MKNIQSNHFFVFMLLIGTLFQTGVAEDYNAQVNQEEQSEVGDKQKYYRILGLSESATQKEIEYAYHKIVDNQQGWLAYHKEQRARQNEINKKNEEAQPYHYKSAPQSVLLTKQFGDKTVTIHGKQQDRYDKVYWGSSTHQDQYGSRYTKRTETIVYDKKNNSKPVCPSCDQTIKEARQAFEALSGKKLERIKLPDPQEINTDNLDQQQIYDYISSQDSTLEGLQAIICEERKKNNIEDISNDIVLGEDHQDLSLLSPEDKTKAEAVLAERLEREKPQRYAEYGMNAAITGGVVTVIALIVRAICLQE